mgnify:CR=1 FL=1|tara:strand:+ start:5163 stop:5687 length:525 start_codon:yes stop_codon:yes gene_type:complete
MEGKIYKITSKNTDKIYIGSTCLSIDERLTIHINQYASYKNGKANYVSSFDVFDFGDIAIEHIIDYPCETIKELERKEGEYILQFREKCVNLRVAGRTVEEYRIEHRQDACLKSKEWRENNKEHYSKQRKEYAQINKEAIAVKQREYYERNKEELKRKRREYYEKSKLKSKSIL